MIMTMILLCLIHLQNSIINSILISSKEIENLALVINKYEKVDGTKSIKYIKHFKVFSQPTLPRLYLVNRGDKK